MRKFFNKQWYFSSCFLLFSFLFLVFGFSALYYYTPAGQDRDYLTLLYLSISTLTTLGYGDVVVNDHKWRLLTSLQSLLGIVFMGIFLNAVWHRYIQKIEQAQKEAYREQLEAQNLRLLRSHSRYLSAVFCEYETSVAFLTSPVSKAKMSYDRDFQFSSLSDMYVPTFRFINPLRETRLEVYRNARIKLSEELKYVASRFDLSAFEGRGENVGISDFIAAFLVAGSFTDSIGALLSYNQAARDSLQKMIEASINIPQPVDFLKNPTLMTPALVLHEGLKNDFKIVDWIKTAFKNNGVDLSMPSNPDHLNPQV